MYFWFCFTSHLICYLSCFLPPFFSQLLWCDHWAAFFPLTIDSPSSRFPPSDSLSIANKYELLFIFFSISLLFLHIYPGLSRISLPRKLFIVLVLCYLPQAESMSSSIIWHDCHVFRAVSALAMNPFPALTSSCYSSSCIFKVMHSELSTWLPSLQTSSWVSSPQQNTDFCTPDISP